MRHRILCKVAATVAVAIVVLVYTVGCGGGGGSSTPAVVDTTAPTVTGITAPSLTSSEGGDTTISAVITDNVGVASAYAIITLPGGSSTSIPMALASGNTYTCTYSAPLNLDETDDTYQVVVSAYDAAHNNGSAGPISFKVPGLSGPPPPPTE